MEGHGLGVGTGRSHEACRWCPKVVVMDTSGSSVLNAHQEEQESVSILQGEGHQRRDLLRLHLSL